MHFNIVICTRRYDYIWTTEWTTESIDSHPILDEFQSCTQGAFRSQFCVIYVPAWECIACAFRVKILNTTWFIYLSFAYVLSIAFAMCHHISRRITLHIKFTVRREPPDRFIQLSNWFSNKCRSSNSLSRLVSSHLIPLWLFQWEEWSENLHFNSNHSIELVQHSIF